MQFSFVILNSIQCLVERSNSQRPTVKHNTAHLKSHLTRYAYSREFWRPVEKLTSCEMNGQSSTSLFKIGPQCVLGVLCLINLFLLVGMLFSHISVWKLNCYKRKGRQVITTYKWKMYGSILLTCFISNNTEGFRANKAYMGNPKLQTLHSKSKFWN